MEVNEDCEYCHYNNVRMKAHQAKAMQYRREIKWHENNEHCEFDKNGKPKIKKYRTREKKPDDPS